MTSLHTLYVGAAVAVLAACGTADAESRASAATSCDRSCLIALARSAVSGAAALPETVRFTENGQERSRAESWLARAAQVDLHGEYADPARGSVIVVGTGQDDDGRPSVFGLRLQAKGDVITEAELIIAHEGEVSVFPPSIPIAREPVFSEQVAPAQRTPGARMIEIADAYFDGIEVDSGADVPVTEDCNRVENGVQTTHSERFSNLDCNSLEVFDYITEVRERRYPLVDEERGVVAGLVAFYIPGGDYPRVVDGMPTTRHYDPRSLFLMEAFKIVDGRMRQVEATMRNMPLGASMGWPVSVEQ